MVKYVYTNHLGVFVLMLGFISIIIPLVQYHIEYVGYLGISSVFINDTASYWGNLISYKENLEFNGITLLGVIFLYYPAIYIGAVYCYLINCLLLIFSTYYFLKSLSYIDLTFKPQKIYSIFALILSNFYLWGVLFFPNKEIPLIFLINLIIYFYLKGSKYWFILLITFLVFFFRDGFSFILICIYLAILLFKKYLFNHPVKFILIAVVFFTFFSLKSLSELGVLSDFQYVIERNVEYNQDSMLDKSRPFYLVYVTNLLNNTFGYAFRAQFFDLNYRIYFAGIGIWHFSVLLFIGIVSWICFSFRLSDLRVKIIVSFLILAQLLLSTSSYPQTRYMMPFIYWLSLGFFLFFNIKSGLFIYLIFFIIALLLILSGLSHDLPLGIDIDNFSKPN